MVIVEELTKDRHELYLFAKEKLGSTMLDIRLFHQPGLCSIEKIIKKDTIVSPEEFREIFADPGTVFVLGCEVEVHGVTECNKATFPMAFSSQYEQKFLLRRGRNKIVTVRGEQTYKCATGEYKSTFKKGKSAFSITPPKLFNGWAPNKGKLKDVEALLKNNGVTTCRNRKARVLY
nr:unnamed protein product [Callosobruchus analis]